MDWNTRGIPPGLQYVHRRVIGKFIISKNADIIGIQEDFNATGTIAQYIKNHTSKYPFVAEPYIGENGPFWADDDGSGHWIDVYNIHMDAGPTSKDRLARLGQITQLWEFIKVYSKGMSIMVMGDFNIHLENHTDFLKPYPATPLTVDEQKLKDFIEEEDLQFINDFFSPTNGTDVIDFVLFRNRNNQISKNGFKILQDGPWSDHRPIYLSLSVNPVPYLPDLKPLEITDKNKENSEPGMPVVLIAKIKNSGPVSTPAGIVFNIKFEVDGNFLGEVSINQIASGEAGVFQCPAQWIPDTPGAHQIKITVDSNFCVPEIDENNNTLAKTINIKDPGLIDPPIPPAGCGKIPGGYGLGVSQEIYSCDGRLRLALQEDGNLVLYHIGVRPLWASQTAGTQAFGLYLQADGNLVLKGKTGNVLWESKTAGNPGAWLEIHANGNMAIYRADGQRIWCTETAIVTPAIPPLSCGAIYAGYGLNVGEMTYSCDGRFRLMLQNDGNLILSQDSTALWTTQTNGQEAFALYMQGDGNLVLAAPTGKPLWSSRTDGNPGARLAIQNDGNLVIYNAQNQPIWATNTIVPPPQACGLLAPDKGLNLGESIYSCDTRFRLTLQYDGNLVLCQDSNATCLWASHTDGQGAAGIYMQGDGNLVIYTASGVAVWSTQTNGNPGAWLALQDDGNLVIYTTQMVPIWASNTGGH